MRPVLERGTIAAIHDKFMWMLCHGRIKVVLYHQHYSGGLLAAVRIFVNGASMHLIAWTETVHINPPVFLQLLGKFRRKRCVELGWKIAQGVAQGKAFFVIS